MVEYKYNAWGTQLSRTGELANTLGYANPFRYRGYIYDDETWMYWLRSRYYYPELHRFISADNVMDGAGLFGANLYAYCKNAPVGASDPSGHTAAGAVLQQSGAAAQILIGALGSAAAAAASPWLLAVACVGGLLMLAGAASNTHTNARSRTEIRSALLSASYGDANARDHSYNTGDYYAAFTIQYPGVNFVSLYYLKEPLTLDEAVDLLTFDALIGALSRAYGFRSSEFGIYTDTEGAASALAAATNGSIDFENHAKKGCRPGDYYTHYHAFAPIHGPHIWFGPPTTILYN